MKRSPLEKAFCIFVAIILMLSTIPLASLYCQDGSLLIVYYGFLVWFFVVVPIIFIFMPKEDEEHDES